LRGQGEFTVGLNIVQIILAVKASNERLTGLITYVAVDGRWNPENREHNYEERNSFVVVPWITVRSF
jgi:hypothetical protein